MTSGVFMKVRDAKQQIQHSLPLIWIWVVRACLQIIYNGECIGQQPIHAL